jgi:hypothetical protein
MALISLFVGGCNQPAVAPKAPAFQSSENTVRDWNDVAHSIATVMASVGLLPPSGQAAVIASPPKPVFVRVQAPDSAFVRGVADELEAEILERGGIVARTPFGATVVNLDVNVIRWGPRDKPPGLLGTTAAVWSIPGIVIGASLPMETWTAADAFAATAVGVGVLSDLILALTPTMNAEAVWEATIVTNDQVLMKIRAPVYIRAYDIPLYAKAMSLSPMSSSTGNETLRARAILYGP